MAADGVAAVHALLASRQWKSAELLCGFLEGDPGCDRSALHTALGDACYGQRQYHRALHHYKAAADAVQRAAPPPSPRVPFGDISVNSAPAVAMGMRKPVPRVTEAELSLRIARAYNELGHGYDDLAIAELQRCADTAGTLESTMLLASLCRRRGSHQAAADQYWAALHMNPFCLEALRAWVELQRMILWNDSSAGGGRGWDGVMAKLRKLFVGREDGEQRPRQPLVSALLKWAEVQKLRVAGQFREALDTACSIMPERVVLPAMADQAESYYRLGRNEEALAVCRRMRTADPLCVAGFDVCAMLLSRLGRRSDLERLATDMLQKAPYTEEAWVIAAVARPPGDKDAVDRVLLEFTERAIQLNPASSRGYLIAAKELIRGRMCDQARAYYQAAQRVSRDVTSYQGLVTSYLQEKDLQTALRYAKDAVSLFPGSPQSHATLGLVQRRMQRGGRAKEAYQKALQLDPRLTDAVIGLAAIEFDEGSRGAAMERLRAAERTEAVFVEMGRLHLLDRDTMAARFAFEEALRINPRSAKARDGLRRVDRADGDSSGI
eukprot:TRINITY_DN7843_c0_g3_i1.p1 TRINITY_DN7843_c0_g3~~TRINITY_DN7843_c0_g3_i1.p1  ORF type:complete len:568 (+),score=190.36 TRINITY_DN7843_c0_g3_i1:52-1704(+)